MMRRLLRKGFHLSAARVFAYLRGLALIRVSGRYTSFEAAQARCPRISWSQDSYWNHNLIMTRRLAANGGKNFDRREFLLRGLLFGPGITTVLDFGGGLGNLYYLGGFQHEPVKWHVVEVPQAVAFAERHALADERLTFGTSPHGKYDVGLIAGTLQYLAKPYKLLDGLDVRRLIVESVPLHDGPTYVAIQKNHALSHPICLFNRSELIARLRTRYASVREIPSDDGIVLNFLPRESSTLICNL